MKKTKRLLAIALSSVMMLTMSVPAFAAETSAITEEEVLAAIANGTASVTMEQRPLLSYTEEEIASDAGLQEIFDNLGPVTYSTTESTLQGSVYRSTVQVGGDTIRFSLYPIAHLSTGDVGTAGGTPTFTLLNIVESVTVNGTLNDDWENLIWLSNIEGAMGCGVNTTFYGYTSVHEDVFVGDETLSEVLAIIATVVSSVDYGTTAAILAALESFDYTGNYRSGTTVATNTRKIGYSWNPSIKLRDSDDCLGFQSNLLTVDSTQPANQSTTAAARWCFDVYFGDASGSPEYSNVTITPSCNYLVNAK